MSAALGLLFEIFGLAAFAGLGTALVLACLSLAFSRNTRIPSIILPWAIALGFIAGYALLPRSFAGFQPETGQPWKWLPYLALVSAAITSTFALIHLLVQTTWVLKLALFVVTPIVAICLAPTWPVWGVEPAASRWLLAGYVLLVGLPLQHLPAKHLQQRFVFILALAAALLALTIGAFVSTRFAQLAAITSFACLGVTSVQFFTPKPTRPTGLTFIPIYATLVAGIAWIACVDPDPPVLQPLLAPVFPASLWVLAIIDAWRERRSAL